MSEPSTSTTSGTQDRQVVVGFLPSPEGEAAVDAALAEAAARSLPLVVVNGSRGGAPIDTHLADDTRLSAIHSRAAAAGVAVEIRQPSGHDPIEELLALSHQASTALLVIGLRRRSPVGKLLMGSSSQRLLLEAECPVLAVKSAR